jgi:iron complex transport system substrate-binding protein
MKRSAPAAIALVTLATIAVAGCSTNKATPTATAPASAASATFPVTEGHTTVTARPTHIVSLSPTATDILFAIGAGSQVVAVDQNSDYFGDPKPAQTPPADLDAYKPNAEAIAAKNPDLVVISNDDNKIQEQLTALKIPVYLAPAAVTIDDTYLQETELGALTGNAPSAAKVASTEKAAIAAAIAKLSTRTKQLTYYYELDPTYYSVTSNTFIGSLFDMAKMTNIADPSDANGKAGGYPQLSAETIIKANPDLIFLADTNCCKQTPATVGARAGWSTLSAVQNKHVVNIDDDTASQWGTRIPALLTDIVNADLAVPTS